MTETNADKSSTTSIFSSPTDNEAIETKSINRDSAIDYDIGCYVGKINELNDFTKCQLLERLWFPTNSYNFPFSLHSKGGKEIKRFVRHFDNNILQPIIGLSSLIFTAVFIASIVYLLLVNMDLTRVVVN